MTRILAIDPGYEQSAIVRMVDGRVALSETSDNETVLRALVGFLINQIDVVLIEQMDSYGMPVGREVFETLYWSGRFHQASLWQPVQRLTRRAVKLQICGTSTAKDANIRLALLDRYGGKAKAVGNKAEPGPLYGVHGDQWAALALAVAWAEGARSPDSRPILAASGV